jgi:hypothetical protein
VLNLLFTELSIRGVVYKFLSPMLALALVLVLVRVLLLLQVLPPIPAF